MRPRAPHEAADLGIDNLEHGFMASTDFVADKQPDVCPGQAAGQRTIAALDENGEPFRALVKKLLDKHVVRQLGKTRGYCCLRYQRRRQLPARRF